MRGSIVGKVSSHRREVGHSFKGLIDSYLGVIADSSDDGVDLQISYSEFYKPGAYLQTSAEHMTRWVEPANYHI
jgi:hypothetical protein